MDATMCAMGFKYTVDRMMACGGPQNAEREHLAMIKVRIKWPEELRCNSALFEMGC